MSSAAALSAPQPAPSVPAAAQRATARGLDPDRLDGAGEQSFSFGDFLSVINPLQHIPIVGSIYRAITGDTIAPAPRVMGGILFGGPMGLITSAFGAVIEQVTGKDIGEHAIAMVMPDRDEPPAGQAQFATAAAATPGSPQSPAPSGEPDKATLASDPPGTEPGLDPVTSLAGSDPAARAVARPLTHRVAAGIPSNNGRSLADYWASAGRPMPVVDSIRSGSASATAPVRLNTMLPASERKPLPTPAALQPVPQTGAAADQAGPAAAEDPGSDPFVANMMRGLDRYREMKQTQTRGAPAVIDATL